jgi:prepilin-type N-terminal cleavage/methylation domain-containing protein
MLSIVRRRASRPGVTLVELVVAMTVAGVVLATIAGISLRGQRLFADMAGASAAAARIRETSDILPLELRGASPASGDIREARDTSLQIRGSIATAVVCAAPPGALTLAPASPGPQSYGGVLTPIDSGDTAWVLMPTDSSPSWVGFRIVTTSNTAPTDSSCRPPAPHLDASARSTPMLSLALAGAPQLAGALGAPVRVTRPMRYSLYRAGDGAWYLGERDWNAGLSAFNAIQPVSGPFRPPSSSGGGGLVLTYFDSLGATLASPVADPRRIAAVQIDLRAQPAPGGGSAASRSGVIATRDSARLYVMIHNRD